MQLSRRARQHSLPPAHHTKQRDGKQCLRANPQAATPHSSTKAHVSQAVMRPVNSEKRYAAQLTGQTALSTTRTSHETARRQTVPTSKPTGSNTTQQHEGTRVPGSDAASEQRKTICSTADGPDSTLYHPHITRNSETANSAYEQTHRQQHHTAARRH